MKTLFAILILFCFSTLCAFPYKDDIDKVFENWDKPNVPGASLGVIQNGKLVYTRGYGMANLEYDIPNDSQTVFRIGSTSKQFTAACIILLSLQDKLKLTDSLDTFFPDFPDYAKNITIQHLLNHTSGVRDYLVLAGLKGFRVDDYYEDEDVMKWLVAQQDTNFKPGDEFSYSNSGYWLLGQIVNKVSGMKMSEFAEKELFKPLGMKHTHFHDNHKQIVKNRASGYSPKDEEGFRINMTTLDMIGDGGIFTTIEDILIWDRAFYKSEILSKEFWDLMLLQGKLNNSELLPAASGLFIGKYKGLKTVSHAGAFAGFKAELLRFPEQKTTIVLFANRSDTNPSNMAFKVADIVLRKQLIDTPSESVTKTKEKETQIFSLKQIAGNYQLEPGVVLEITIKEDYLFAFNTGMINPTI